MENYVVYTEMFVNNSVERWYYGRYDYNRANEMAMELGNDYASNIFHCVCTMEEARELGVKNLPC